MARAFLTPIDLSNLELLNARVQNLAVAPAHSVGRIYYDTALGYARISTGTAWIDIAPGGTDAEAVRDIIGSAIGAGTNTNVTVTVNDAGDTISFAVAADGAAATPTLRTLGTGATQAAAGNDARLSDQRVPTDNSVTNAKVPAGAAISADKLADGTTNGVLTITERTRLAGLTQYTDTNARANRLDQFAAPTAAVSLNSQKITNLAEPTNASDAATKNYVDATAQGLDVKPSVVAATTGPITLSGTQTIDGVAVVVGNRVLVKNQASAPTNGIYVVASGAWTRATDFDSASDISGGAFVFIEQGTTQADTGWVLTTNNPVTLGTTALDWAQFSSSGAVVAGAGMTQAGNTLNVIGGTGITVNADNIQIDNTVVVRKYAQDIGDGAATAIVVTHNLGTRDVQVRIFLNSGTFAEAEVDVEHTSINTVTLRFAAAPSAAQYRAVIQG